MILGPFPSVRLNEMIENCRIPAFQRSAISDNIIVETVQDEVTHCVR
jgi:hypothetical protein